MKNKTHKFIIKAFLESRIPPPVRQESFDLVSIDYILAGYCTRLLDGEKEIDFHYVISKEDKKAFSELINRTEGDTKTEIMIYYRLAILTEEILLQYSISNRLGNRALSVSEPDTGRTFWKRINEYIHSHKPDK